jgi:hypothetical protein
MQSFAIASADFAKRIFFLLSLLARERVEDVN